MLSIDSRTGRPAPSIAPICLQKMARSFVLTFLPFFLGPLDLIGAGATATTTRSSLRRLDTSDISLSADLVPWTVFPLGVLAVKMNSGMWLSLSGSLSLRAPSHIAASAAAPRPRLWPVSRAPA
jgi:hypothetical protein